MKKIVNDIKKQENIPKILSISSFQEGFEKLFILFGIPIVLVRFLIVCFLIFIIYSFLNICFKENKINDLSPSEEKINLVTKSEFKIKNVKHNSYLNNIELKSKDKITSQNEREIEPQFDRTKVCDFLNQFQPNMDINLRILILQNSISDLAQTSRNINFYSENGVLCNAIEIKADHSIIAKYPNIFLYDEDKFLLSSSISSESEDDCELEGNSTYNDIKGNGIDEEIVFENSNGLKLTSKCKINGECSSFSLSSKSTSINCEYSNNTFEVKCDCTRLTSILME